MSLSFHAWSLYIVFVVRANVLFGGGSIMDMIAVLDPCAQILLSQLC